MSAELIIPIKANADQMLATIKLVTDQMDKLSAKINSLPTGDKQLNKLVREYTRLSNTQQGLLKSFDRLGTGAESTVPKIKKTEDATKNARTALTSLSLTLQDLPFGFIGIQNNLPGVIQGFGNLSTKTEGLKGVTAALITQLKGPAGVFLAFSAVTTVVTFLVQKYGSLGGAIDALIGKQNSLTSQISKFNDEYEKSIIKQQLISQVTNDATASQSGQIAVIQNLTKKATDLTLTQEQQKNALEQLQQISGDYYSDLKTGASNVDLIRQATEKYLKVIIAQARIRKYSDEIDVLQEQIYESERLQKEQDLLIKSDIKRNNQIKNFVGTSDNISASIVNQINIQDKNRKVIEDLAVKTFNLNNRVQDFKDKIDQETNTLVENTKVKEKGAKATRDFFASYRPSKEYFDFFKDLKNTSIYDDGVKFFNDLSNLDLTKGNDSVKQFNEILKDIQDRFPNKFSDIIVSSPQDLIRAFSKLRSTLDQELKLLEQDIIDSELNKRLTEQFYTGLEIAKDTFKQIREEAKKTQKSLTDLIPPSTENIIGLGPAAYEKAMAQVIEAQKKMKEAQKKMLDDIQATSALLGEVFFDPLQEQFRKMLDGGKFSFKEFGKAVLDNLKQLAAKILATGIITLLATILTGGFSAGSQLKTGMNGFEMFGKAFSGALGFGGGRSANFGGVNPGGLAMSGAVSLSLRGSDLVGAINRTNTNISRIG
jgi:hypothetical protein